MKVRSLVVAAASLVLAGSVYAAEKTNLNINVKSDKDAKLKVYDAKGTQIKDLGSNVKNGNGKGELTVASTASSNEPVKFPLMFDMPEGTGDIYLSADVDGKTLYTDCITVAEITDMENGNKMKMLTVDADFPNADTAPTCK